MCGRFIYYTADSMALRFELDNLVPASYPPSYNVCPGQRSPVIYSSLGKRTWLPMTFGIATSWSKSTMQGSSHHASGHPGPKAPVLINARAEKLLTAPTWRSLFPHNRCLILANGFYEWQADNHGGAGQPYLIRPTGLETFAFAGLYSSLPVPGETSTASFVIVTTTVSAQMAGIHDRMPVILEPAGEAAWLDSSKDTAQVIGQLRPFPGELEVNPVTRDVNSPCNNHAALIEPL